MFFFPRGDISVRHSYLRKAKLAGGAHEILLFYKMLACLPVSQIIQFAVICSKEKSAKNISKTLCLLKASLLLIFDKYLGFSFLFGVDMLIVTVSKLNM